jgi:hypothetical protein
MSLRYLELDNICHLNQQQNHSSEGVYSSKLWRESYYFNFTDPSSGFSLITTIGILPNKKLLTGLILLIKNNKAIKIKLLIQRKKITFNDYSFFVKGLEYKVIGPYWKLSYRSDEFNFDICFKPINKIFEYVTTKSDLVLNSIGSQHYEQFGIYKGEFVFGKKEERVEIGPCLGHRDHSWGIRDWSSVDKYRLFCCAFSKYLAINLWEGYIQNKKFLKGYVFDGVQNSRIVQSKVISRYQNNKKVKCINPPIQAKLVILDEKGRIFQIISNVKLSVAVPPRNSILYECFAEMRTGKSFGFGLQEYLFHEPRIISRLWILLKALRYL